MGALRRQLQRKSHSSPEWRKVLQLLASTPRGVTNGVLEFAHGFSRETLAMLTLGGFATVMTETLKVDSGTFTVERLHITDAGWQAIGANRT